MTEHNANSEQRTEDQQKVTKLIKGIRVAMITSTDAEGRLVSRPMATQDVEFDGTVWFIAERHSDLAQTLATRPQVNVAYVGSSSWVSLTGTAQVINDVERLRENWSRFTDAWMEGGPENPENIMIRVDADTAQYWDSPGSKVTQLANLAKSVITGKRLEGDNQVVDL